MPGSSTPIRPNVLLSCAGRRAYLAAWFREALAGAGDLVAIDSDPTAPALQEADKAFVVPPVRAPGYVEQVLALCTRFGIGLVISLNDVELELLAGARPRFEEVGVHVAGASLPRVRQCLDKLGTAELAAEAGLLYPQTYTSIEEAQAGFAPHGEPDGGLIVKPRWGTGSIGTSRVRSTPQLLEAWNLCRRSVAASIVTAIGSETNADVVVAQTFVEGPEFGLDLVHDLRGQPAAFLGRRKLGMRAGETDRAVSVRDPELEEVGRRLSGVLGHTGVVDCDFIRSSDGWVLLDVNPRFGGGYPFSHAAGADVPRALVAWLKQEVPESDWLRVNPGISSAKADRIIVHRTQPVPPPLD